MWCSNEIKFKIKQTSRTNTGKSHNSHSSFLSPSLSLIHTFLYQLLLCEEKNDDHMSKHCMFRGDGKSEYFLKFLVNTSEWWWFNATGICGRGEWTRGGVLKDWGNRKSCRGDFQMWWKTVEREIRPNLVSIIIISWYDVSSETDGGKDCFWISSIRRSGDDGFQIFFSDRRKQHNNSLSLLLSKNVTTYGWVEGKVERTFDRIEFEFLSSLLLPSSVLQSNTFKWFRPKIRFAALFLSFHHFITREKTNGVRGGESAKKIQMRREVRKKSN